MDTTVKKLFLSATFIAFSSAAHAQDGLAFELGGGAKYAPAYFGASEMEVGPTGKFRFGDGASSPGLSPHASFRFIGARTSADHPELTGLEDVSAAFELGGGLAYEADQFRLFTDLRQGFGGHSGQVMELGGDLKLAFGDKLSVTAGPRALFATGPYFDAYFNVSSSEAAASAFAAYDAGAGLVSTGAHLEARYQLNSDWALVGTIEHDVLRSGAAASPITQNGSPRQTSVSLVLNRRFSF